MSRSRSSYSSVLIETEGKSTHARLKILFATLSVHDVATALYQFDYSVEWYRESHRLGYPAPVELLPPIALCERMVRIYTYLFIGFCVYAGSTHRKCQGDGERPISIRPTQHAKGVSTALFSLRLAFSSMSAEGDLGLRLAWAPGADKAEEMIGKMVKRANKNNQSKTDVTQELQDAVAEGLADLHEVVLACRLGTVARFVPWCAAAGVSMLLTPGAMVANEVPRFTAPS